MTVAEYYLLKADTIHADRCTWWRPDSQGYTTNLDEAGLYTEAKARSWERSSGQSTIAVHRSEARKAAIPTVAGPHLRETGALAVYDLHRKVEDAWRGPYHDNDEAAAALGWTESLAERVSLWHSTDVLRIEEWGRVAASVRENRPGDSQVHWPVVLVSLEADQRSYCGKYLDVTIARAEIGKLKLSEVDETLEGASAKLIEAARVRGRMSRGEPA